MLLLPSTKCCTIHSQFEFTQLPLMTISTESYKLVSNRSSLTLEDVAQPSGPFTYTRPVQIQRKSHTSSAVLEHKSRKCGKPGCKQKNKQTSPTDATCETCSKSYHRACLRVQKSPTSAAWNCGFCVQGWWGNWVLHIATVWSIPSLYLGNMDNQKS